MSLVNFFPEKEFKNSEVGKIPKDWKISHLKHFINVETGKRDKGGALPKGVVASIGGKHIGKKGRILWNDMKFISDKFFERLTTT